MIMSESTVCNNLLDEIKIIDEQVAEATRLKDFYEFQLNYIRFTMVVKSTKDMYQQSKHYRKDHLHG
jgi:hypothetical protein